MAVCMPLEATIDPGFAHLGKDSEKEAKAETLCTRLVWRALSFAIRNDLPCTLVLDAFFSVGSVFALALSVWSVALKRPYLHSDSGQEELRRVFQRQAAGIAWARPTPNGEKIKLTDVFELFKEKLCFRVCMVYGRAETVSYYTLNLLWKLLGQAGPVRPGGAARHDSVGQMPQPP
jgi:hypothetical protein